MAKVVIFDENATPQNVLEVKPFVSPQDYEGRTDIKMFGKGVDRTELTVLEGVHRKYWKHDNGSIVEMTQGEKDTVDATELANALTARKNNAEAKVDALNVDGQLLRAIVLTMKDEINILRALHALPDRTNAQVKTSLKNKIQSGEAD